MVVGIYLLSLREIINAKWGNLQDLVAFAQTVPGLGVVGIDL